MGNALRRAGPMTLRIALQPRRHDTVAWVPDLFGTSLIGGTTHHQSDHASSGQEIETEPGLAGSGSCIPLSAIRTVGITRKLQRGNWFNNPFGSLTRYPIDGPFRSAPPLPPLPLLDIKTDHRLASSMTSCHPV